MNHTPLFSLVVVLMLATGPAWSKPQPKAKLAPAAVVVKVAQLPPTPEQIAQTRRMEERLSCMVEQTRFQSEMQHRARQCEVKANETRQCIARVRDRQSSNTGKGALLGLGAAVLTGGASLLFTGAGALVGHATSDEAPNECGAIPNCDGNAIMDAVARETGLRWRECPTL